MVTEVACKLGILSWTWRIVEEHSNISNKPEIQLTCFKGHEMAPCPFGLEILYLVGGPQKGVNDRHL